MLVSWFFSEMTDIVTAAEGAAVAGALSRSAPPAACSFSSSLAVAGPSLAPFSCSPAGSPHHHPSSNAVGAAGGPVPWQRSQLDRWATTFPEEIALKIRRAKSEGENVKDKVGAKGKPRPDFEMRAKGGFCCIIIVTIEWCVDWLTRGRQSRHDTLTTVISQKERQNRETFSAQVAFFLVCLPTRTVIVYLLVLSDFMCLPCLPTGFVYQFFRLSAGKCLSLCLPCLPTGFVLISVH